MRAIILLVTMLTVGCAQTPVAQNYWYNPGLNPSTAQSQKIIDSAECEAYAYQNVKTPEVPRPQAPPVSRPSSNYTFSGNVNSYSTDGVWSNGSFQGIIGEQQTYSAFDAVNKGRYIANQNSAHQQQRKAYATAINMRSNLAGACMRQRGWVLTPTAPNHTVNRGLRASPTQS